MPQSSPKKLWLITYGASSPNITQEMLYHNSIKPDEVFTLEQRDLKYTLIHIKKRSRFESLEKCMHQLHERHKIILQDIVGYQAIMGFCSMNDEISDHPGFKLMVQNISSLHAWAIFDDPSKGLLWKYSPHVDYKQLTKSQVITLLNKRDEALVERKRKSDEDESIIEVLQAENSEKDAAIKKLEDDNKRLCSKVSALRALYHAAR